MGCDAAQRLSDDSWWSVGVGPATALPFLGKIDGIRVNPAIKLRVLNSLKLYSDSSTKYQVVLIYPLEHIYPCGYSFTPFMET